MFIYIRIQTNLASSHDFEESIQTVKFSSRQSTATCYIKINDDDLVESTEAFQVEILIPRTFYSQGIKFGSPSKVKVFIKDGMLLLLLRNILRMYMCISFR